jgi:hypothetical protein
MDRPESCRFAGYLATTAIWSQPGPATGDPITLGKWEIAYRVVTVPASVGESWFRAEAIGNSWPAPTPSTRASPRNRYRARKLPTNERFGHIGFGSPAITSRSCQTTGRSAQVVLPVSYANHIVKPWQSREVLGSGLRPALQSFRIEILFTDQRQRSADADRGWQVVGFVA